MQDNTLYLVDRNEQRLPARIVSVKDLDLHGSPLISDYGSFSSGLVGLSVDFMDFERKAKYLNRRVPEKILIEDGVREAIKVNETKGIALKFSHLSSEETISDFAGNYGLLDLIDYWPQQIPEEAKGRITSPRDLPYFESVSAWEFEIKELRSLLEIYTALRDDKVELLREMGANWNNISDNKKLKCIATKYLIESTLKKMAGKIYLDYQMLGVTNNSPLKHKIVEKKATQCLLAVIYHDLWQIIINEKEVYFCKFCHKPLPPKNKRQQYYCDQACAQAEYRRCVKEGKRRRKVNDRHL